MDEKLQRILEQKYKVVWKDTEEYTTLSEEVGLITDPVLKNKLAGYILNQDPLYYTFGYEPLIKVAQTKPNVYNLFQNRGNETISNGHTILEISPDEYFYKGMKSFYRTDELTGSAGIKWFGEETIAFKYARRYHGGLNVYKPIRPVKLLVYTNYNNLKKVVNYYQQQNSKTSFLIKIKTGVDISIFTQIDYYMKYMNFDTIWLNRNQNISPVSGEIVPIFPKLTLWGRGKIDREVGMALCNYCKIHGFDGYISYEHYTPFMNYAGEEIVMCDYYQVLERAPKHPLDWLSWEEYLPIKLEPNFLMEESYSNKNNNFQIIKFWNENKSDSPKNKQIQKSIKEINKKFVISTLNVHSFYSINHYDKPIDAFQKLIAYLIDFDIDLLCLEEFAIHENLKFEDMNQALSEKGYTLHFTETVRNFGNAIISKYPFEIIEELVLTNDKEFKMIRKATFFKIDNEIVKDKIFCVSHLEIGRRYTSRQGSLLTEEEIKEIIKFNSGVRSVQIQEILNKNPDIIMGDFNFNPDDTEFELITKKYNTDLKSIDHTTPFGTIVDYIFYRNDSGIKPVISVAPNYRYSDHLPVLNVIKL
jgi:endonuclease/exonuclease/phosphatase family metal-dependent hydrolase